MTSLNCLDCLMYKNDMNLILLHGSGHKASSWDKTIVHLDDKVGREIFCLELSDILGGKKADYRELCASFADYCNTIDGPLDICGLSLGGIIGLEYTISHPERVRSLVLIGTPHKVPKTAFAFQNLIFRFLPASMFDEMAFDKKGTFELGNSMKELNFTDRVQNITCPVLIICGEKDKANIKSARYFAEHMISSELKIFDNIGHIVNEEAPEKLAMELERFYDSISEDMETKIL